MFCIKNAKNRDEAIQRLRFHCGMVYNGGNASAGVWHLRNA